MSKVAVIGGGFAGCECANALSKFGEQVDLFEMKPNRFSPAHSSEKLCEVVCSNSFKAKRISSASGLLKAEMSVLGSLTVECACLSQVQAGGALAVDREVFSSLVTEKIANNENITVQREEISEIPKGYDAVVIATGPLSSEKITEAITDLTGIEHLGFYDAAAPIVSADSIDMSKAFTMSRYENGEGDYINCPMNKQEYETFYNELVNAERAQIHEFEKGKNIYEGCMPIEVMAMRGADTIRFGPMKPVGLRDPSTGHRPWAVLQLRQENRDGTMYNLVGFQTNLKFSEQKRVFSLIPALHDAEFVRYGVMHRNTFLNSPKILNFSQNLRNDEKIFFAGQITGVEGYMESASSGITAAINVERFLQKQEPILFSNETMLGAFQRYIADEFTSNFQPMGASFGMLPPLKINIRDKKERYEKLALRSLDVLKEQKKSYNLDVL